MKRGLIISEKDLHHSFHLIKHNQKKKTKLKAKVIKNLGFYK